MPLSSIQSLLLVLSVGILSLSSSAYAFKIATRIPRSSSLQTTPPSSSSSASQRIADAEYKDIACIKAQSKQWLLNSPDSSVTAKLLKPTNLEATMARAKIFKIKNCRPYTILHSSIIQKTDELTYLKSGLKFGKGNYNYGLYEPQLLRIGATPSEE